MKILYKYKNTIGKYNKKTKRYDLNKYTKDFLQNDEIYFSKPSELNDPYDSQVLVEQLKDVNDEIFLIKNNSRLSEHVKKAYINGLLKNSINSSDIINKNKEFADIFRIFCLTPNYNNMLMWSHYCNSHQGISVGIKVHNQDGNFCIRLNESHIITDDDFIKSWKGYMPLLQMDYDINDNPPSPVGLFEYRPEKFKPFLLKKSNQWKYEEEYRVLLDNQIIDKQKVKLYHSQICEVYLGLNIPLHIKNEIIGILKSKENYDEIDIYSFRISNSSYKLERVKLN